MRGDVTRPPLPVAFRAVVLVATVLIAGNRTPLARADQDPAPPVLVAAQGLTDNTVRLIWMAVAGAESYVVYRDGVGVAWPPGTRYDDTPLAPSAPYSYQVSSVVGGVESAPSTTVSATTQAPQDASPPSRPGSMSVSNIEASSATLKWGASTDDVAVLAYLIFRGPPDVPVTDLVQIAAAEDSTSYSATNLKSGTAYQFAVVAIDAGANQSAAETKTFTTGTSNDGSPPAAPSSSSVTAKPFSSSRIDVVWGVSSSSDVAGYKVYRDGVVIAEVTLPLRKNYSDNGLEPGSAHNYQIQAFDSAGNLSSLTSGRIATTTAAGVVQIQRGPYLQWTTGDSVRVAWWTNIPADSTVSYGIEGLSNQVTDASPTSQHVMLIGGLSPGATYTYQVTSGGVVSSVSTLTTAAPRGATFSFAAVGDYGGGSSQETAIANLIANAGTQFVQTLGDNVYPHSEDPDFATTYSDFDSRLYKPYGAVMKKQTFWAAGGNHEYFGGNGFWQNFWLPNNERWYGYDWGDAHFLVLDTEQPFSPGTPQYQFAEADLAANQDDVWRIAVVHRPPYSSTTNNSSSNPVRTHLVPLFEQQRVQLALTGHSHNYERTYPLLDGEPRDGGVTYMVSGGGGNGVNQFVIAQPSWSAFRQASYEYLRVFVSPLAIQVEARSDADILIDSVTLGPGGPPPPAGSISANLIQNHVSGFDFTPNSLVTVNLFDSPGGTLLFSGFAATGEFGEFDISQDTTGVDLVPGMHITVTDDTTSITKGLLLVSVSFDVLDPVNDIASGTAPPGMFLVLGVGEGKSETAPADQNGDWFANDFGPPPAITPDMRGEICAIDSDGDCTEAEYVPEADLTLTKTDPMGRQPTGRNMTYTLTVANSGPRAAYEVAATDQLPSSVTFVSATPSQGSCGQSGGTVTCNLGTVRSGDTATIEIVVKPTVAVTIINTASVTASTPDSNGNNNADSVSTSICRITSRRSSIPCG